MLPKRVCSFFIFLPKEKSILLGQHVLNHCETSILLFKSGTALESSSGEKNS